jgi:putative protein-disulfide isomerase
MAWRTLHYIYDPLCGWCYGAAPLLKAAAELDGLKIELHAGGMMMGARRQPVTPALRQFVMPHDRRIAELSGQPFGEAYREGLLNDAGTVFDSQPPITAILAAEESGHGLAMLDRIQRAHYVEGRRIADRAVLGTLAVDIGLAGFEAAYERCSGAVTQQHVDNSRALLQRVGGAGFPTFAYESGGAWLQLESASYFGRVEEWRSATIAALEPIPGQQFRS